MLYLFSIDLYKSNNFQPTISQESLIFATIHADQIANTSKMVNLSNKKVQPFTNTNPTQLSFFTFLKNYVTGSKNINQYPQLISKEIVCLIKSKISILQLLHDIIFMKGYSSGTQTQGYSHSDKPFSDLSLYIKKQLHQAQIQANSQIYPLTRKIKKLQKELQDLNQENKKLQPYKSLYESQVRRQREREKQKMQSPVFENAQESQNHSLLRTFVSESSQISNIEKQKQLEASVSNSSRHRIDKYDQI